MHRSRGVRVAALRQFLRFLKPFLEKCASKKESASVVTRTTGQPGHVSASDLETCEIGFLSLQSSASQKVRSEPYTLEDDLSKKHLGTGLACMSLIFAGMVIWRDYSRRARMQAVKHAADTPQETMDVATLAWALESNSEPLKRDAARVVAQNGKRCKGRTPSPH